jgi:flagellar protein FliL
LKHYRRRNSQDEASIMAAKAKKTDADEEEEGQATEEAAESGDAERPKGRFSLKLILIVVGAVAVLGGGGTGGYLMFGSSKETKPVVAAVKPPAFVDVPEVLVNLANTGASERTQYLKVKIVLELPDSSMQPQVQTTMPRVMDAFQTYLRELRPSDLEGSAGLYRLKEELTRRVNVAIAPSRINAVLFKEIVLQ